MMLDPDWRAAYARMTNPFGAPGSFYDGLGHRGADYRRSAGQTVPCYAAGVVGEVEADTSGLGGIVGVAFDDGGSAGWAHLANIQVEIGDLVEAGTILGYASGGGDSAGSLWDGAHIHTTRRLDSYAAGAARGIRPLVDPVPYINAALAATAGGSNLTPLEDDMYTDDDRARDRLTNEAVGRIEQHAWAIHKTVDELRYVIIGNDPGAIALNAKLASIQDGVNDLLADADLERVPRIQLGTLPRVEPNPDIPA